MKSNFIKSFPGSLMLSFAVLLVPMTSYAVDLPSVQINNSGKINVSSAEVTSVSGDTITGIIKLKNATTSATIKTNASTTVQMKGDKQASSNVYSSSSVKVGDIINISGIFTGFTTSLNLTADKIRNLTALFVSVRLKSGKVESVNVASSSFVIKTKDNKLVTVVTNATTTFQLSNKATTTLASGIVVNGKVDVKGVLSADGSVMTASVVTISKSQKYKEDEKDNDKSQKENKRFFGLWKMNDRNDR